MTNLSLVGRCGLYCGACTIYRAHKDKAAYLRRVANFFNCPPEKVKCEGCHSLTPDSWGIDCKIVKCLKEKGFEFCFQCSDYQTNSCEKYNTLARRYLEEDNVDLRVNLERIEAGGVEQWLQESKAKFMCPHCGKALSIASRKSKCYRCDANLSSS